MKRLICLSLLAGSLLVLPMTILGSGGGSTTAVCVTGKFRLSGRAVGNLPLGPANNLVNAGIACVLPFFGGTNGDPCSCDCVPPECGG